MKWLLTLSLQVLLLLSCNSSEKKLLDSSEFIQVLDELGVSKEVNGKYFIIMHTSECLPNIEMLGTIDSQLGDEHFLILIDRFESRFNTFINRYKFQLKMVHDSEGLFIQKGVLPYTPIVVLLSTDGSKISYTEFDEFLDNPTESLIND